MNQDICPALFESAPMGILLIDEEGAIVQINAAVETLFGYDQADLVEKPFFWLLPERFRAAQRDYLKPYLADPSQLSMALDLTGQRRDGSEFLIEVQFNPLETTERPLVACFITDITKRRHLEQELSQYIRELNAFAHTVAHDLKDPLGIMVGYAEMTKANYDSISEEDLRHSLYAIAKYGRKIDNIIDELLLMADNLRDVETQPLDTPRLIHEAQLRLFYLIEEYDAEISIPDEETWPSAWGYGPWVEEIWVNYISNAVKYGGTDMKAPHVVLGATAQKNGMVRFWVRDNGTGLTPEEQANLFVPFVRLDEKRLDGHGLGLSIVQRIIERLSGEVGVESAPGEGSTFWFTLPAGPT